MDARELPPILFREFTLATQEATEDRTHKFTPIPATNLRKIIRLRSPEVSGDNSSARCGN